MTFKKKFMLILIILGLFINIACPLDAYAKKKKKLSEDEIGQISDTVNLLMKKVYGGALFSPKDNDNMVDIKIKLDDSMGSGPGNKAFPQIYYKLGIVYKDREYRDEAIECFQTILDSFPDSPYAAKSINELKKMGVKVAMPGMQP